MITIRSSYKESVQCHYCKHKQKRIRGYEIEDGIYIAICYTCKRLWNKQVKEEEKMLSKGAMRTETFIKLVEGTLWIK